jgi:uncharacterized membrane protein
MGIAITLCFVAGVVCGMVASGKGRSFPGWFVIGMLLPVVGLILILVLPSNGLPFAAGGRLQGPGPQGNAHLHATTLDAAQRLGELKARGDISDLELQEKKAELLARL